MLPFLRQWILGDVFDKISCETDQSSEVAKFDGSEKCGQNWTEHLSMEEIC